MVGLRRYSNGRSCCIHKICGACVVVNDIIRVRRTIVTVGGKCEQAGKAVLIRNGVETCTVGFIPKIILRNGNLGDILNSLCQITELYKDSESTFKRSKDHRLCGMAACRILDSIPPNE